jgi:hypothetical protein
VVYLITCEPDPPKSFADSVTATGEDVNQPLQLPPPHNGVVCGAVVSATTVNGELAESVPAALRLVTFWLPEGAEAVVSKLYAPPVLLHPVPSDGKLVEATVDSGSFEELEAVKSPFEPGRK